MSKSDDLVFRKRDGIGYVVFNRPEARNALTFEMQQRLLEICDQVNADTDVRALIVTGTGERAFTAGIDVSQFRSFTGLAGSDVDSERALHQEQEVMDFQNRTARLLDAIETCRVPTVAAIQGACVGDGLVIAAACDLRICSPNAVFGMPIARTLGNCLSMPVFARLTQLIGAGRLADMIFTARLVSAQEALAMGLVMETPLDAIQHAEYLARRMFEHAPLTLRATREALRRLRPRVTVEDGRDLALSCYLSRDFHEGIDAFLHKRPPHWRGE